MRWSSHSSSLRRICSADDATAWMTGTDSRARSQAPKSRPVSATSFSIRRLSRSCGAHSGLTTRSSTDAKRSPSRSCSSSGTDGGEERSTTGVPASTRRRPSTGPTGQVPASATMTPATSGRAPSEPYGDPATSDVRGEAASALVGPVYDLDAGTAAEGRERGEPAHPAGADTMITFRSRRSPGGSRDDIEGDVRERARGPVEPGVGLAARAERDLEEPVEDGVDSDPVLPLGERDAELVQDLVFAEDGGVEAAGDLEQVVHCVDALEPLGTRREGQEAAARRESAVEVDLHAVAGVDDDRLRTEVDPCERGRERLALEAVDASGVEDVSDDLCGTHPKPSGRLAGWLSFRTQAGDHRPALSPSRRRRIQMSDCIERQSPARVVAWEGSRGGGKHRLSRHFAVARAGFAHYSALSRRYQKKW